MTATAFDSLKFLLLPVALFLPLQAWSEPSDWLSLEPEFEVKLCPQASGLLPGTQGDPNKTIALCQELYRRAGPKNGCRFVESCYLLVLGDMRPYGGWNGFIHDYSPADQETFDELNRYLVPRGISIHPEDPGLRNDQVGAWEMYSLGGLERRTHECSLAWVPKYQRAQGWPGLYAWNRQFKAAREEHVKVDAGHFSMGFMLGYPDSAITGFTEMHKGGEFAQVEATIPQANYYDCGLPIFSVRPQDSQAPDIAHVERAWNDFLTRVYASAQHQKLRAQSDFLAARRQNHPTFGGFYQEGGRQNPPGDFTYYSIDTPNTSLEAWLQSNGSRLLEQMRVDPDMEKLAQLVPSQGHFPIHSKLIARWILRGAVYPDANTQQLAHTYRATYPAQYRQLLQREILAQVENLRRANPQTPVQSWTGALQQLLLTAECRPMFECLPLSDQEAVMSALLPWRDSPAFSDILKECQAGPDNSPYRRAWKRLVE